jgi:hypothetical protein
MRPDEDSLIEARCQRRIHTVLQRTGNPWRFDFAAFAAAGRLLAADDSFEYLCIEAGESSAGFRRVAIVATSEADRASLTFVTYYTVFVIELATRRVQIVGSTPHPNDAFMIQAGRTMTALDDEALTQCRVLICDRDRKWSAAVRQLLEESAVRVVQTPF